MTSHDHDDLPYCGVRAMQAQEYASEEDEDEVEDEDTQETIPISYYIRDFPVGCFFSFPIKIAPAYTHMDNDDSEENIQYWDGIINPVRLYISIGAKLNLKSATLDERQSPYSTLYVSTDENPDFLPLYHFDGKSSCSLGLEICGPANIYLAASSFDHNDEEEDTDQQENGYINIFGTVDALDDRTVKIISEARDNLNKSIEPLSDDVLTLKRTDEPKKVADVIMEKRIYDHEPIDSKEDIEKPIQQKRKRENEDNPITNSVHVDISKPMSVDDEPLQMMMSKKQRKKLAKQKAKELEDILAKARGVNSPLGAKPSSEIPTGDANNSLNNITATESIITTTSKPLSQTRERRLEGGIFVRDIIIGTGDQVRSGRKVSITYIGSFPDTGKVFDKNVNKKNPLIFRLGTGEVIKGLERGMEGMRVGGERTITIPPELGYGKKGMGKEIPSNATLHFSVQLIHVGRG